MRRALGASVRIWIVAALVCWIASAAGAQPSYVLFEGGPVRPVALSPNGQKLFVANAPEGHLEIFDVGAEGVLTPAGSVPVGLEPVTAVARTDGEVWVVNHLSDSVSIVDVASTPPRVTRTLLVGDEPRDLVFAGTPERAFITTAHRGQHRTHGSIAAVPGAGDPQLTTEGIGRADVWVFDAASPGSILGGVPVQILSFFADTPRALATDGTTVYVAAFHSGNRTTGVPETSVPNVFTNSCGAGDVGVGMPGPSNNANGDTAPQTGLIVQFDGTDWVDSQGCSWNGAIELELPDQDVFAVDANTLAAGSVFSSVGTILFNMVVNPTTGKLYVTNTESRNTVRFEGPGDHGGSTVQGRLSESRITVLDPAMPTAVDARHLNKHIDYGQLHTDAGANHSAIDAQIPHSLATPLQAVVSSDQKIYVAAFGSAKVGVFDVGDIEDPDFDTNFDPTVESANYIATGGGPSGLALNGAGDRLFVYTRFDNRISVFKVGGAFTAEVQSVRLPSAEPASVVDGRPVLYDAVNTSGNGEASCAACHIFGDFDSLAWDLGNPDDPTTTNPQDVLGAPPGSGPAFHPMKGPMTTQTLRGMSTHGALHWRGDRSNGFFNPAPVPCLPPAAGDCDEALSFDNFIVAFEGLIGHHGLIATTEMQKFTDFAMQLTQPPNPVANIDGTQTPAQSNGESHYFTVGADAGVTCNVCHTLAPASGFFGSGGSQTPEGETQLFKVAHLRNMYQKVGMFGLTGQTGPTGDQVRGFGFLHDGVVDTLFNFLDVGPFALSQLQIAELEQFMLAFPSDLAPVVGQQVSVGPGSPGSLNGAGDTIVASVDGRIGTLDTRASAPFTSLTMGGVITECDLIAHTVEGGSAVGYSEDGSGDMQPDNGGAAIGLTTLKNKAKTSGTGSNAQNINFSCVPPGSGTRMGIDRDLDGVPNGTDNCPAWPNAAALGTCTAGDAASLGGVCNANGDCGTGGACSLAQEDGDTNGIGDACELSLLPEPTGAAPGVAVGLAMLALARTRRANR